MIETGTYTPGYRQKEILRTIECEGSFQATTRSLQRSCMNLHQHGYLVRDPKDSFRWTLSDRYIGSRLKEIQEKRNGKTDFVAAALTMLSGASK